MQYRTSKERGYSALVVRIGGLPAVRSRPGCHFCITSTAPERKPLSPYIDTASHFTYRRSIDGLRAVAVLSVILYHSGVVFLPGGYVGVDVSFVISGFVITSVVQGDLAEGRFSPRTFYERRIRRIFPALFAMIAGSLVLGWCLLMPDDFKRLGQSSVANALFLSNFYFLKDTGYFGATAAAKPLLNTWSLAVEEQFYLLLPLYLLMLKHSGARRIRWLTAVIAVVSLALSILATPYEPHASFLVANAGMGTSSRRAACTRRCTCPA